MHIMLFDTTNNLLATNNHRIVWVPGPLYNRRSPFPAEGRLLSVTVSLPTTDAYSQLIYDWDVRLSVCHMLVLSQN